MKLLSTLYGTVPVSVRDRLRPRIYAAVARLRFYRKIAGFIGKSTLMAQGVSGKLAMIQCAIGWLRLRGGHPGPSKAVTFQVGPLRIAMDTSRHEIYPFWEIWCDDDYERSPGFRAAENSTVVDVGGNIGLYTMRQAVRASRGRVVVFEPAPDTFRRLKANIELNGLANVTLVNAAVGAEKGSIPFVLHAYSTRCHVAEQRTADTVDVPCTTLDLALQECGLDHVDLMKIDAEGHERAVLEGATSALGRTKRLVIEVHRNHDEQKRWVESFLSPLGFRVVDSDRSLLYLER